MDDLKIQSQKITLVDQVEEKLITYFKEQGFQTGSAVPNEMELAAALGVARSVLREALSRFKMIGMIESRTRRGMVITEPSLFGGVRRSLNPLLMNEHTILDLLEFRIALEIGISGSIFLKITPASIQELEEIVRLGAVFGNNQYAPLSEYHFHTKLYEITGNKTISEFQEIIHPVLCFVRNKYKDFFASIALDIKNEGKQVTHEQLLQYIKNGDEEGYKKAIEQHFLLYRIYLKERKLLENKL